MAGKRTVTVIFTDLVGSTALSHRLDAKAAEELRQAHFGMLQEEVAAVGGMVVKNLGDGLMVLCDTPTTALSCAVGMQQAVERSNRGAVEPLAMRVGIATGEATESDGDFFGDPVVEAARLCAVAEGGQILATDVVRVVAGRHAQQDLVSVGTLELKGLPDPVPCVEVCWEPVVDEPAMVPLQGRLEAGSGVGFVGRAEELAVLAGVLKEAGAVRRRRLVLVGGEPGIGKSALAGVFARSAHADGAAVLYGRCDEDLGIPYQPWAEAVAHLVDHAPPGLLDDVLAAHGGVLAHLGPGLAHLGDGGVGGSADPETARYLLFGAVLRVLQAAGGDHPLVLVLDDLQWADTPTLQLLRHLVSFDHELPVAVVATYRDSEVSADGALVDLLAWLHREAGVIRISLQGLGEGELLALMEVGVGHAVDESGLALRDALARETDGNPFFVGELLRHLIETGVVYQDIEGRWAVGGDLRDRGLPVSVREVIGRRVARLGAGAVRVLSVASVIGRDFDLSLLASAADTAEDQTLDVLDAAVAATLVVNAAGQRYSFSHALVEHALYDGLTPGRRVRAHRRVGEAIEQACGADPGLRVGELAYHWAQGNTPADAAKAMSYARSAGDRALAQLAPGEALRWYDKALNLLDEQAAGDDRLRATLLVGLGDAQRQTGHPAFGETLLAAGRLAQRAGDTGTLITAALANNRGMGSTVLRIDADRVAIIEAALTVVDGGDSNSRARLWGLLALERVWDAHYPARRAVADEALAMARRLGDSATLLDVLLRRHDTIWGPDTLAERLADTAEAEVLADQLHDPISRFWSAANRMIPAIESADLLEYTRCVEKQRTLAGEVGQPTLRWRSAVALSTSVLLAGDADAAEALAEQGLRIGTETGQPDTLLLHGALLGPIRWHQGRSGELIDMSTAIVADYPRYSGIRAGLAKTFADAGHDDDARALIAAETAAGFPHPRPGPILSLVVWAEPTARLEDSMAAAMLYERLAPWSDQVPTNANAIYGAVAHYLGHLATVLGRYDTAEAHFAKAQAIHERLQAPFHLARTHLEWGRMLIARAQPADADEARTHLELGQDLAERYGCSLVEQRASELLHHA